MNALTRERDIERKEEERELLPPFLLRISAKNPIQNRRRRVRRPLGKNSDNKEGSSPPSPLLLIGREMKIGKGRPQKEIFLRKKSRLLPPHSNYARVGCSGEPIPSPFLLQAFTHY